MSEPPHDDRTDDPAGSAPWERPRRWNQQRLDATRVDDLLARLGNEDEMGGRRRRRRAAEATPTDPEQAAPDAEGSAEDVTEISASELIAALQNRDGGTADPEAATEPPTRHNDPDSERTDDLSSQRPESTDSPVTAGEDTDLEAAPDTDQDTDRDDGVDPDATIVRPHPGFAAASPDVGTADTDSAAAGSAAAEPTAADSAAAESTAAGSAATGSAAAESTAADPAATESTAAGSAAAAAGVTDASGTAGQTAGTDDPDPRANGSHDSDAQDSSDAEKTSVIPGVVPPRPTAGGPGVVTMPGYDDDSRTDQLPQIGPFEDVASIRESLRRQHAADPTFADPDGPKSKAGKNQQDRSGKRAAPVAATALAGNSGRQRGVMWAGRSVIAVVAAAVLVIAGIEWNIWTTHNNTLAAENQQYSDVLDTGDSNIATPSRSTGATEPAPGAAAPDLPRYEPENILLLGSDTRSGGNGDDTNSNGDDTGAQSDTLMIAHLSADRQNITILSVPRDLQIKAPECNSWNSETGEVSDEVYDSDTTLWKITNAYSVGGPKCTVKAVQALTGLRIDRVIGIDFNGFKSMVDALHGINLNVCKRIYDDELGLIVADGGEQVIQGDQALSLVRARKVADDGYGNDYGRIHRQQVVLSAILRQVTSSGTMLNPGRLNDFLNAFTDATFAVNVDLDFLVDLARELGDLSPGKVTFYTLPAHDNPNDGGDSQLLDEEKADAVFTALVNDQRLPGEEVTESTSASTAGTASSGSAASAGAAGSSSASSPTSSSRTSAPTTSTPPEPQLLTVEPSTIDLQVVNVTGGPGIAGQAQEGLNSLGFDISDDQLWLPEGVVEDAITVAYSDGNRDAALTVAAAVPGSELVQDPELGTRVQLRLGTTYTGQLAAVSVGQDVPSRLQTTPADNGGEQSSAGSSTEDSGSAEQTESSAGGPAGNGSTQSDPSTPAAPSVTLRETDLESVNANDSTCA